MSEPIVPFSREPEVMFFVFARQKGSSKWIEQESSHNKADVIHWAKRNNERNAKEYESGSGREYIAVKRTSTFEEIA